VRERERERERKREGERDSKLITVTGCRWIVGELTRRYK
jgi:hypothetical protein